MANTLLMTNRPVVAANNPEANVQQINGQQSQPMQNSAVSPITIPIQIQPQLPGTMQNGINTNPQQANIQNNLQVNPQNAVNSAPTPQTYNANNNANKVVDFNQIYNSYQNSFGNSNTSNTNTSGIKKTSLGTTIVTPTTNNLNSVEGQYQSSYSDTINGLIGEMLNQMNNGFQYDPNSDSALKVATEYASNSTLQSLAGSGVLNSSATAERVARIVSELIPQYEQKAHDRWIEYLGQLADTAQVVMGYDSQQFEYWKDAKDREFENKKMEYQKQQDALDNAWKRVDELGYVDNGASAILGVPVGTLSGNAREAKEQREFELKKMREQAEIEHENQKALYKLKSELDTEKSKELAEYEYKLQQKYGGNTSKNNTTKLDTYKNIINNRWADKDLVTDKYTISDNDSAFNFLATEYSYGRLSLNDYTALLAMYGIHSPTSIKDDYTGSFGGGNGGGGFR